MERMPAKRKAKVPSIDKIFLCIFSCRNRLVSCRTAASRNLRLPNWQIQEALLTKPVALSRLAS
jgi:hypothetical protein